MELRRAAEQDRLLEVLTWLVRCQKRFGHNLISRFHVLIRWRRNGRIRVKRTQLTTIL